MKKITVVLILCLFPSLLLAKVYKCVDANGGVSFLDRPCEENSREEKTNIKHEKKLPEIASSNELKEMEKTGYLEDRKVKNELDAIGKAAALKLYTRKQMYSHIEELCSITSPQSGVSDAVYDYFREIQDSLVIGEKIFREGFEYPEKNYSVSASELRRKTQLGKDNMSKKFTVSNSVSKESVVSECNRFARLVASGAKLGL